MIHLRTDAEIELIRRPCRIAAEVLAELGRHVKPGIATIELDEIGEELIRKKGAQPAFKGYRGYRHATCISLNWEVVHGIPGKRKLKEGDIASIDVGTRLNDYFGDTAATFPVGGISRELKELVSATRQALDLAVKQSIAGNYLGDVSHAVESVAKKNGFSVVKDLFGHGIGRELHEDPLVPNFGEPGTGPELKPGMVFAIEPMLNAGGSDIETLSDGWTVVTKDMKFSAHFEHTIAVTKNGPVILTEIK